MSVMAKTIRVLFLTVAVMVMGGVWADTWTDPDTGYTWTYYIYDTIAGVYSVSPATGPVIAGPAGAVGAGAGVGVAPLAPA